MTWRYWDWVDAPIIVTDIADGHTRTVLQKTLHTATLDAQLARIIRDPCTELLESSIARQLVLETEAQQAERRKRRRDKQSYQREAWATKFGGRA